MKKSLFWILCSFSPLCLASIGLSTEFYIDHARGRTIEVTLVYPSIKAQSEQTYAENVAFYGFNAAKNGEIAGNKLPVYILVHGTSGNWKNLSWLARSLAHKGALVVSGNHPSYTTGQATPESVIRMWDQPRDVSFLITKILSGKYAANIDEKNITVVGYSLGGYTAMALAGARLDIYGYQKYCSKNQDESCKYFDGTFSGLSQEERSIISADYRDRQVTTSVAIAPGFVPAILPGSLKQLSAKTIIVGAEFDKNVPPRMQLTPYLNGDILYKELAGASHFSFMQNCKPEAVAILAEEGEEFVCQEATSRSRESIHTQLFQLINQLSETN